MLVVLTEAHLESLTFMIYFTKVNPYFVLAFGVATLRLRLSQPFLGPFIPNTPLFFFHPVSVSGSSAPPLFPHPVSVSFTSFLLSLCLFSLFFLPPCFGLWLFRAPVVPTPCLFRVFFNFSLSLFSVFPSPCL